MITIICVIVAMVLAGGAGFIAGTTVAHHAVKPSLRELAERAEAAGMDLASLAGEIRMHAYTAATLPEARLLKRWAERLRDAAGEHLECINAIQLSDLREAGANQLVAISVHDAVAVGQREQELRRASHV